MDLITYAETLRRIEGLGRIRRTERVALGQARGRVLAADIVAREELPPFDNTAVDGFAVRAADLAGASRERPVRLRIGGAVFAGETMTADTAAAAAAVRIMTGAPVPAGFDAAVKIEDVAVETADGGQILVCRAPVTKGANLRWRGEDVTIGQRLVLAPRVVTSGVLTVAAGQGIGELDVLARPVLRFVATGDELVDDPSQALRPGQIRNTSLPFLLAEADRLGLPAIREGLMADREDEAVVRVGGWLAARPGRRLDDEHEPAAPEIVVSTGAVSVGDKDFVPATLRRCGFELVVHRLAVRPGKPVLIAGHAETATFWVGLPGNVLSTAAGFRFFVVPLVRSLFGLPSWPTRRKARLTTPFPKPAGLRFFARGALRSADDGALEFTPEDRQASGMSSALAGSDAYGMFPEAPALVPAGATIDVAGDDESL
ncbi:MAG: molybdopterin molybdotransferase MoeA [Deltaproteobacteria bacterium]|nr:molybdopterin molybdotransferase MoeA [Deltaproteobacteria bacterium]